MVLKYKKIKNLEFLSIKVKSKKMLIVTVCLIIISLTSSEMFALLSKYEHGKVTIISRPRPAK